MEHHDENFHSLEDDPEISRMSQFAADYEQAIRARKGHFPQLAPDSEPTEIPDFDTRLRHAAEVVVQDNNKWIVPQDGAFIPHDLAWENPHDARDFVAYLYSISDLCNVLSSCFHDLYERSPDEDEEIAADIDADWHHAMHNIISSLRYLLPLANKGKIADGDDLKTSS